MTDGPAVLQEQSSVGMDKLVDLVRAVHLTPTQRNIVRTLIANADRAAYLSATEVAELAQVSQPSVTRFAAALGFDGYPQLRAVLREARTPAPDGVTAARNEWQRSIDFELAAMQRLRDGLGDERQVRQAAAALVASRPLVVAGHRSAASIAQYIVHFAAQFLDDVRLVPSPTLGPDLDLLVQARAAGGTAVLVAAFPRYAEEALAFMDVAHELGFEVTCITDSIASLAASKADRLLVAPVDSSLTFDSYAVPMLLANVLVTAMAEVDTGATQARLEQYDAVAERNGVFRD